MLTLHGVELELVKVIDKVTRHVVVWFLLFCETRKGMIQIFARCNEDMYHIAISQKHNWQITSPNQVTGENIS